PRAAQFPAALQHCADAADRNRTAGRRQAAVRARAMGAAAVLGQGPEEFLAPDQCPWGIVNRQTCLSRGDEIPALPRSGGRLLRMEGFGSTQAALFRACEGRWATGLCRVVGNLDR